MRAIALLLALLFAGTAASAADRHAGYYYPPPTSFELYIARTDPLEDSDRRRRIGFTVGVNEELLERPYPPDYVLFAKGADAEKLIIVALRDDVMDTVYRGRALLAQLTALARGSPLFAQMGVEDSFTFYELARLLGYEQLTISDGRSYSHQVRLTDNETTPGISASARQTEGP